LALASTLAVTIRDQPKRAELMRLQQAAVAAAMATGCLMRRNLRAPKKINAETSHDIKLELDVRCQNLIERKLRAAFPQIGLLGEEGTASADNTEFRWVVDPIDGTVNFASGIPHACVSIALQVQSSRFKVQSSKLTGKDQGSSYSTVVGVVYDPFTDELWTAIRGEAARLNGKPIRVSRRRDLAGAIVSIGFSKTRAGVRRAMPYFLWLSRRVRKIRLMGSAALALTYVATGRFDAYIERGISLWDIAAGGLILECAGGKFWRETTGGEQKYRMVASNGLLHRKLPLPR
jgi:myo-inositol-1(or 4)-monophosphatase